MNDYIKALDFGYRMTMVDRYTNEAVVDEFNEGMAWLEDHDCKQACRCLAEKGEPMYV